MGLCDGVACTRSVPRQLYGIPPPPNYRLHSRLISLKKYNMCFSGHLLHPRGGMCHAVSDQTQAGAESKLPKLPWRLQTPTRGTPLPLLPKTPPSSDTLPLELREGCIRDDVIGDVLSSLSPYLHVNDELSDHGGLVLGLKSSQGAVSILDLTIGKLHVSRMLACARSKLWWMTPEWRRSTLQLPPETQFLLMDLSKGETEEGPYALMLPLIDDLFRGTIRPSRSDGSQEGDVDLRVESGDDQVCSSSWEGVLYIGAGTDPYELIQRGVTLAARLSGGARPRVEKKLPPSLDQFGWCSWDAFYSSVSARGLQEGLASLNQGGIFPGTLIIDDGWQMTDVDKGYRKPVKGKPNHPEPELKFEAIEQKDSISKFQQEVVEDFMLDSMEMLAETAASLPCGTSMGCMVPALSSIGAEYLEEKAKGNPLASGGLRHMQQSPYCFQEDNARGTKSQRGAKEHIPLHKRLPIEHIPKLPMPLASHSAMSLDEQLAVERSAEPGGEVEATKGKNSLLARAFQKPIDMVMGMATMLFVAFYQRVIEPAPPNSWPVKCMESLALGPFRSVFTTFFANATDFTRRLVSVQANSKFSSPNAGPEAESQGAPERLWEVVASIKETYNVKYVYCWHGLAAYWGGISPDSEEMKPFKATLHYPKPTPGVREVEPAMAWSPATLAGVGFCENPGRLYRNMHEYLAGSGVDGVKVDCQAGVGLAGSVLGGGPLLSRQCHEALEASIRINFEDNHCINCMCHSTENLYRMADTAIARVSDDFYPRDPASSNPHVAACSYNSLFMSVLVMPDWDMFHSKHPAAQLHAMARAVSGGAVYVSDKPGQHDFDLLHKLVLPDGTVLRARQAGRPTRDSLFSDVLRDGTSLLKVWNMNAYCGMVAVFNLQGSSWDREKRKFYIHNSKPAALTTMVRPSDVDFFIHSQTTRAATELYASEHSVPQYVAYSHTSGSLTPLLLGEGLYVSLQGESADVITVAPLTQTDGVDFAPIGFMDMINSGGAIVSCTQAPVDDESVQLTFRMRVHGCGRFLVYTNRKPSCVTWDQEPLTKFSFDEASKSLVMNIPQNRAAGLRGLLKVVFN